MKLNQGVPRNSTGLPAIYEDRVDKEGVRREGIERSKGESSSNLIFIPGSKEKRQLVSRIGGRSLPVLGADGLASQEATWGPKSAISHQPGKAGVVLLQTRSNVPWGEEIGDDHY